ncbi:hypothetical protein BHE74_00023724 [Ensete ventricosum]|nr:hypothetical protein BHE74_00023724 [Ensete ventricosum]
MSSVRIYPEFEVDSSKGEADGHLDENPRSEQVPSASSRVSPCHKEPCLDRLPASFDLCFVLLYPSYVPIGRPRRLFTCTQQSKSGVVGNDNDETRMRRDGDVETAVATLPSGCRCWQFF